MPNPTPATPAVEASPREVAKAVEANSDVVVQMPDHVSAVSHGGIEHKVDKKGRVKVHARAALVLVESHGGMILKGEVPRDE